MDAAREVRLLACPRMRRFATWTTGHRKTVIIGWIVALIGIGMIAGSVGSDFSEEFKLPASDSPGSLRTARRPSSRRSPATPRRSSSRPTAASNRRRSRRRWKASSPRSKSSRTSAKSPAPTRKAAPPRSARTARSPTRRSSSTSRPTNSTKTRPKQIIDTAQGAAGNGLQVELGGQPIEEAAQEEGGDSSFAIGLLAAIVILLLTFGSVVAMGLPIITALFALGVGLSLVTIGTHVFDTANFAPRAGGDDRARRRDRLRALHPHPLPQRPRRRPGAARRRRSPPSTPPGAPCSSPGSR